MIRKYICLLSQRESLSSKAARYTFSLEKIVWRKGSQCLQDVWHDETQRGLCPNNRRLMKTLRAPETYSIHFAEKRDEGQRIKERTLNPYGISTQPVSFHTHSSLNHSQGPCVFKVYLYNKPKIMTGPFKGKAFSELTGPQRVTNHVSWKISQKNENKSSLMSLDTSHKMRCHIT